MPRTPKICGHPGRPKCLKIATHRGRCPDHQIAPFEGAKQRWNSRRPKGYEAERQFVIRNARGVCEQSGCTSTGVEVDKIIPDAESGRWSRENMRLLCKPHHEEKTQEDALRGRQRRR